MIMNKCVIEYWSSLTFSLSLFVRLHQSVEKRAWQFPFDNAIVNFDVVVVRKYISRRYTWAIPRVIITVYIHLATVIF